MTVVLHSLAAGFAAVAILLLVAFLAGVVTGVWRRRRS